jgi:hypothetical protein
MGLELSLQTVYQTEIRSIIMAVQKLLLSICCGAILEAILFVCVLPAQPITILRSIAAYTQAPGDSMLRLVAHFFPLGPAAVPLVFTTIFLAQTALFALPVWILLRLIPEDSTRGV